MNCCNDFVIIAEPTLLSGEIAEICDPPPTRLHKSLSLSPPPPLSTLKYF